MKKITITLVFSCLVTFFLIGYVHGISYFEEVAKESSSHRSRERSVKAGVAANRAAEVRVASDGLSGGDILTKYLRCRYTTQYVWRAWWDKGSGASADVAFWRPLCPEGWVRLGDLALPHYGSPDQPCLIVKDDPRYLRKPVRYERIWCDKKSGADEDGSVWYPVPPEGFLSLGCVAQRGYGTPDVDVVRCVRQDLVAWGEYIGHIWTDRKSGAREDCGVWSFTRRKDSHDIPPNTFFAVGSHGARPPYPPYVLIGQSPEEVRQDTYDHFMEKGREKAEQTKEDYLGKHKAAREQETRDGESARLKDLQKKYGQEIDDHQQQLATDRGSLATWQQTRTVAVADFEKDRQWSNPDCKEELSGGGETAEHDLPNIRYSSRDFDRIREVAKNKTSIDLGLLPTFDAFPFLKEARIENARFIQGSLPYKNKRDQESYMAIIGNAEVTLEKAGKVRGKIIALSRLYVDYGIRTAFVVFTDTSTIKNKITYLNDQPLRQLNFSDCAVVFTNEKHTWKFAEFPDQVRSEFRKLIASDNDELVFEKNESFFLSAEVRNNNMLKPVFGILESPPPKVLFTGLFPQKKGDSFKLRARLLTKYNMKYFPPGLNIGMPDLEITVGENIALISFLDLNLSSKLKLHIPARIDFPIGISNPLKNGVSLTGFIPGEWKNPLKIKGLTLKNLALSGTIGEMDPAIGFKGIIDMGLKLDMAGALSFRSPVALSALKGSLPEVGIKDVLDLQGHLLKAGFPGVRVPDLGKADLPIEEFKIKDFALMISTVTNPALGLEEGLMINGKLYLSNTFLGSVTMRTLADKGAVLKTYISRFDFGPIKVTGAGPDTRHGTADDAPIIDFEYWPLTSPPYNLRQHCYISGRADLFKAPMDVCLDLRQDSLIMQLYGKLGGLFESQMRADGSHQILKDITRGGSLNFEGEFREDFTSRLQKKVSDIAGGSGIVKQALKLVGGTLFRVKSARFKGSLDEISKGRLPELEIQAVTLGSAISYKTTSYNLGNSGGSFDHLAQALVDQVLAEAKACLGNLDKLIVQAMTKLASEAQEEAKKVLNEAEKEAKQQAQNVEKAAEAGAKIAGETASKAAKAAEETARKVKKAIEDALSSVGSLFGF